MQCQKKSYECPNKENFFIRHNLKLNIDNSVFNIYESISKNDEKRFIVINSDNKCIINKNSLLSIDNVEGYATNFIKKTSKGFYYSFEYGNKYHYEYELYFEYTNGIFNLSKIVQKFSDLSNPNSLKSKTINISNKNFSSFNIYDYLPK